MSHQLPLPFHRPAHRVAIFICWPATSHKPLRGQRYCLGVEPEGVAQFRRLGFRALGAEVTLRRLDGRRVRMVRRG